MSLELLGRIQQELSDHQQRALRNDPCDAERVNRKVRFCDSTAKPRAC